MKPYSIGEEEKRIARKAAEKISDLSLSAAAILFLESYKPLSFVGSQLMTVFNPIVKILADFKTYDAFQKLLETRGGLEFFISEIENVEREKSEKIKRRKKDGEKNR